MHVNGLDRHQWTEGSRILDDYLRNQPRVDQGVVRIHKNSLASCSLAPLSDINDSLSIGLLVNAARRRASRKEVYMCHGRCVLRHLRPLSNWPCILGLMQSSDFVFRSFREHHPPNQEANLVPDTKDVS